MIMRRIIRPLLDYYRLGGVPGMMSYVRLKLWKKAGLIEVRDGRSRHPLFLRAGSSDLPTYQQVFVDEEYRFKTRKDPKVIVDAGANVGFASVYFAQRFPECVILAIEPESSNFALLEKNVASFSNITPVKAALWNHNEEISLMDPGLGNWAFTTESRGDETPDDRDSQNRETVQAMTVDRIMQEHALDHIDILKVDIEGSEKEVFSTSTEPWMAKVDAIIAETHDDLKPGCSDALREATSEFEGEWINGENIYRFRKDSCVAE